MGLCGDSTTVSGTVKLFPDSKKRTFAWRRAVILPETAFSRALPLRPNGDVGSPNAERGRDARLAEVQPHAGGDARLGRVAFEGRSKHLEHDKEKLREEIRRRQDEARDDVDQYRAYLAKETAALEKMRKPATQPAGAWMPMFSALCRFASRAGRCDNSAAAYPGRS